MHQIAAQKKLFRGVITCSISTTLQRYPGALRAAFAGAAQSRPSVFLISLEPEMKSSHFEQRWVPETGSRVQPASMHGFTSALTSAWEAAAPGPRKDQGGLFGR